MTREADFDKSLESNAQRYKKSKRNLFVLNSIFALILVIIILLPLPLIHSIAGVATVIVAYGFFRLYTLN